MAPTTALAHQRPHAPAGRAPRNTRRPGSSLVTHGEESPRAGGVNPSSESSQRDQVLASTQSAPLVAEVVEVPRAREPGESSRASWIAVAGARVPSIEGAICPHRVPPKLIAVPEAMLYDRRLVACRRLPEEAVNPRRS